MAQITKKTDKHFPEDILFEVVSRLPPKSVGRFTTVSKSWYAFIRSPTFVATHLNRSIARNIVDDIDSSTYLLYVTPTRREHNTCTLLCDKSFDEVYDLELPMDFESKTCRPVGSCNGLVCLTDRDYAFCGRVIYVWNPLLRKFKCIIGTSCCCNRLYNKFTEVHIGFWYDGANSDYKLIRIMYFGKEDFSGYDREQSHVEVYSLNKGSWRKIDDAKLPGICSTEQAIFVDGTLNWMAVYSAENDITYDFIMSFDTQTELFRKIVLPDFQEYQYLQTRELPFLVVYKGWLAFFVAPDCGDEGSDVWSIWVMKKFGVVESWVKEYNEETQHKALWPIGFTKNNEILIDTSDEEIFAFNFETKQSRILKHYYGYRDCWVNYTKSLVFLEEKNELLENGSSLEGHRNKNLCASIKDENTNS
ncbi:F-box/kelch-repeat protein [Forsythia ovata]|uniref:F-box/kelch-repeat protein n=1 Tax=Forsythia ovata TaxID=205694 RepID=A0ABD1PYS5_9LAMI